MSAKIKLSLGAEPRKVAYLVGLLVVAGAVYVYENHDSSASSGQAATAPAKTLPHQILQSQQPPDVAETTSPKGNGDSSEKAVSRDFRPSMKHKQGETIDPERFDPTIRTDLLDKLADVRVTRVERSLFDFSATPQVQFKQPEPKIEVRKRAFLRMGPEPPPPPAPPPVKPPPPAIPLRFYGRALPRQGGQKRVFCVINDEVMVPFEGDILQHRYQIHRINPDSVVVEDLEFKNNQTLPIEEPSTGGA